MTLRQSEQYISDEILNAAHKAATMARLSREIGGKTWKERIECRFYPKVVIFFDGTMNNYDVSPDNKSNVARLFMASHDDPQRDLFRRYIPGVGTPYAPKDNQEVGEDKGGAIGAGFGKGGDMRLKDAMLFIEKMLGKNYTTAIAHIKMLRVDVIGFSRGATLARAFVNKLLKEKSGVNGKGQLIYKLDSYDMTVPLEVGFVGLFDTVASVGGPALHRDWASDLRIPSEVKRCVHLVAAHEVRQAFPLDSIAYQGSYPENSLEVIYPGVHSDIGGGYYPDEQGRSIEYTKIPLREMYLEAIKAGVPLMSLKEMEGNNVDKEFSIENKDKVVGSYHAYREYIKGDASDLVSGIWAHRPAFFKWRSEIERKKEYTKLLAGLADSADCEQCLAAPDNKVRIERNEKQWKDRKMKTPTDQGKELITEQKRLAKQMKFLDDPYERVGKETVARKRNEYEELIFNAWNSSELLPAAVDEFFTHYVHDSVAAFDSWPCALYDPRKIFLHRDTVLARHDELDNGQIV
ncbi:hypothetical protein CXB49_01110 [Chromobacterium sp. ATCC 53434]|uniref:T6SS phospholipase effector Tle1-like catalytic domain-containing protein n=1 Tax=Chromobacterium sp. (strain ATCC 53434 / SC 14030) TaxID=2059672 RepID=UPI000C76D999|nr:DUF2235 domain-containing protein [Chromobacterium sp. ATCC 53434]AUH49535.1 hypothetical protein CXB49_01110 [Chromobacterium sp. ATCC 53434]